MGPPPLPRVEQTDRQTCVKTLPSRTLHMRAVKSLLRATSDNSTKSIDDQKWGVR